jgi:hypothetical protein
MTNTYPDDAPMETKLYEEMRCLRCVLERILRVMDEGLFIDYQMEKFFKISRKYKNCVPPVGGGHEGITRGLDRVALNDLFRWEFRLHATGVLHQCIVSLRLLDGRTASVLSAQA